MARIMQTYVVPCSFLLCSFRSIFGLSRRGLDSWLDVDEYATRLLPAPFIFHC